MNLNPKILEAVRHASEITNVPAWLILSVIESESSFNPEAIPPVNPRSGRPISTARGLMQVTFPTWQDVVAAHDLPYTTADFFDIEANVTVGAWRLADMYKIVTLHRPEGDKGTIPLMAWRQAVIAYHVGPTGWMRTKHQPAHVREYASKIMARQAHYLEVLDNAE